MRRLFAFFAVLMSVGALAVPCDASPAGPITADRILILKSQRLLLLLAGGEVVRSYPVALGQTPLGHKQMQGDKRTPEGRYFVDGRNPRSRFHLSLHLSYPNAADLRRAQAAGVPPGGDIAIHGMPEDDEDGNPAIFYADWTEGCIAVGNRAIEEIWNFVPDGTPVDILR